MSKGRLASDKWWVGDMGFGHYIAERTINGKYERMELKAHCLQCAKVDVLAERGGKVDLRGWNKSECGSFLLSMQSAFNEETVVTEGRI